MQNSIKIWIKGVILISRLKIFCEMAVVISMSVILSFFVIFRLPLGGSVTLAQTLPLIWFSLYRGCKYGTIASCVFGIVKLILSFSMPISDDMFIILYALILDYILSYMVIGFIPLYVKKIKNFRYKMLFGGIFANVLRMIISIISGALVWGKLLLCHKHVWCYSIAYNSSYMIPEIIITALCCFVVSDYKINL